MAESTSREVELNSVLEWVNMALDGEPVSDFATSFPIVARAQALFAETKERPSMVVDYSHDGDYVTAQVTLSGRLLGVGTSRKSKNAVAYALEDLARAVKEEP